MGLESVLNPSVVNPSTYGLALPTVTIANAPALAAGQGLNAATKIGAGSSLLAGLNPISTLLTIGGLITGAQESRRARKAAEEANRKQRMLETYANLVNAAGGRGVQMPSPEQPIPVSTTGSTTLGTLAALIEQGAGRAQEAGRYKEKQDMALRELASEEERRNAESAYLQQQAEYLKEKPYAATKPELSINDALSRLEGYDKMLYGGQYSPSSNEISAINAQREPLIQFLRSKGLQYKTPEPPPLTFEDLTETMNPLERLSANVAENVKPGWVQKQYEEMVTKPVEFGVDQISDWLNQGISGMIQDAKAGKSTVLPTSSRTPADEALIDKYIVQYPQLRSRSRDEILASIKRSVGGI